MHKKGRPFLDGLITDNVGWKSYPSKNVSVSVPVQGDGLLEINDDEFRCFTNYLNLNIILSHIKPKTYV